MSEQGYDPEFLTALCESRYALVLEAARLYAPGTSMIHDIVQQTFLIFLQGIADKKWDLHHDPDPLFYGIAKKVALGFWREEKKHRPESLKLIDEILHKTAFESEFENHRYELTCEKLSLLKQCMRKIPLPQRTFLELHYNGKVTIEEIAGRNGIKPNTLRQMFCRLRAKLRECIEKFFEKD